MVCFVPIFSNLPISKVYRPADIFFERVIGSGTHAFDSIRHFDLRLKHKLHSELNLPRGGHGRRRWREIGRYEGAVAGKSRDQPELEVGPVEQVEYFSPELNLQLLTQ